MVRMRVSQQNDSKDESKSVSDERPESGRGDGLVIFRTDETSVAQSATIPAESDRAECPICLNRVEDRALIDQCLHQFCLRCIEKWSQTSNTCPLCRRQCTAILHNIRSTNDYDRIPVVSKADDKFEFTSGVLLLDQSSGSLWTPTNSGIYMVDERQTPHGIRQNILFLAPNQNFVLQNLNPNTTFVTPENISHVLNRTLTTRGSVADTHRDS